MDTSPVDRLTADTFFLVLSHLTPLDVLRIGQVSRRFRQLNQNPTLFRALLPLHYPHSFITASPRQQYQALTMGYVTTYSRGREYSGGGWDDTNAAASKPTLYFKTHRPGDLLPLEQLFYYQISSWLKPVDVLEPFVDDPSPCFRLKTFAAALRELRAEGYDIRKLAEEEEEEDVPRVMFAVPGLPVPAGTKAWLLLTTVDETRAAHEKESAEVFVTRELLVRTFANREYDRLHNPFHALSKHARSSYMGLVRDDSGPLSSPAALYAYLMSNDQLIIGSRQELTTYTVKEVTF
jgi:hypothetical protein